MEVIRQLALVADQISGKWPCY